MKAQCGIPAIAEQCKETCKTTTTTSAPTTTAATSTTDTKQSKLAILI